MAKSRIRSDALAIAATQITSGVLALQRMITSGVAGAPMRVNANANALESGFPLVYSRGGSLGLSPTFSNVCSITVPEAGSYLIEADIRFSLTTLTAPRTMDMQVTATNMTSMYLLPESQLHNAAPQQQSIISASGAGPTGIAITAADVRMRWRINGRLVVNNGSAVAFRFLASGDAPTAEIGCWARATRIA